MNDKYVEGYSRTKKFLLWFGFTFAGFFLPAMAESYLDLASGIDINALVALVLSIVNAAFTATLRVAVAQFPVFRVDNNIGTTK